MLSSNRASSQWRAPRLFAALVCAATPLAALAADVTPFTVALPTVSGPIASTATDFPYIANGFDVQPPLPDGYVEEEYFVSGSGNLYEYTPTGIQVVDAMPRSRHARLHRHPLHHPHAREAPDPAKPVQRDRGGRAAEPQRQLRHRRRLGPLA